MKKIYYIFAIIASVSIFTSCSKDEENSVNNDGKVEMTFGVTLPNEVGNTTRAVVNDLSGDNPGIYWENGDEISVFTEKSSKGDTFRFDTNGWASRHNTGTFSGRSYANAGYYYGLYPAQSTASLVDGKLAFNIPDKQTAVLNTFDPKAGIQIGKAQSWDSSSNVTLGLKNVCAYFAVTVGEGCESVIVTAQSNADMDPWYLAGDVKSDISKITSGGVSITEFVNCQSSITLSGGVIKQGGTFLIPFIPSSQCPKIFVKTTFYANSDNFNQPDASFVPKTEDGKFQFQAGRIYDLGEYNSEK